MAGANVLRVERAPALIRSQVTDNLRQAILDRRLAPGQRLIERELVEMTGVSRTSVREALRELAAEGLVTAIPNKGTVVASVSAEEARQIYQVREALEALAGRLFVQNASPSHLKALRRALEKVERAADKGQPILAAKDAFYDVLFEGGGNDALKSVAGSLHARVSVLRSLSTSVPGRLEHSVEELQTIVDAAERRDADAVSALCALHVKNAGRAGLEALAEQGES
ncbi:GntR family transcriptional regulator [Paractinoplanes hotanensis]|uniref:GntR family transcriptional regulator n=1 Tax=Paractinoplanes hotanensis TaxID=2906497 RepID=A0ABT0XTE2_9ACTN|nr:GntR family transcriptional regulator [Actinoplanes hotanensis]MCM4076414.1 GntR family transcriptional regulator [Actinoplanes hotanensis]